jgi:hypothetical protein
MKDTNEERSKIIIIELWIQVGIWWDSKTWNSSKTVEWMLLWMYYRIYI